MRALRGAPGVCHLQWELPEPSLLLCSYPSPMRPPPSLPLTALPTPRPYLQILFPSSTPLQPGSLLPTSRTSRHHRQAVSSLHALCSHSVTEGLHSRRPVCVCVHTCVRARAGDLKDHTLAININRLPSPPPYLSPYFIFL